MAKNVSITKEIIINATINLVRENGQQSINARDVAKHIGCSTQPIYSCFKNMFSLKMEVVKKANEIFENCVNEVINKNSDNTYKESGITYIKFARDEKELFKLLFMRDRKDEIISQKLEGEHIDYILDIISENLNISKEKAYKFHTNMWVFVHGIATMIATGYYNYSDEQISELLTEQYWAYYKLYSNK